MSESLGNKTQGNDHIGKEATVKQVMSTQVKTIGADDTSHQLMELMTDQRIAALPVLEDGKCIGMVTSTDLLNLFRETNQALHGELPRYEDCLWAVDLARRKLDETKVRDLMSIAVVHIDADDPIGLAAKKMRDESLHHLAVMSGDQLVGIISSMDLLKVL